MPQREPTLSDLFGLLDKLNRELGPAPRRPAAVRYPSLDSLPWDKHGRAYVTLRRGMTAPNPADPVNPFRSGGRTVYVEYVRRADGTVTARTDSAR